MPDSQPSTACLTRGRRQLISRCLLDHHPCARCCLVCVPLESLAAARIGECYTFSGPSLAARARPQRPATMAASLGDVVALLEAAVSSAEAGHALERYETAPGYPSALLEVLTPAHASRMSHACRQMAAIALRNLVRR